MNDLGPSPAPRLEPIRAGDREPGQPGQRRLPPRRNHKMSANRELSQQDDFVIDETNHELDEQA
jgi:hypothetical protein